MAQIPDTSRPPVPPVPPGLAPLPGLAGAAAVGAVAVALNRLPGLGVLSPLILAILIGLGLRAAIEAAAPGAVAVLRPGARVAQKRLLRAGVVLLGFQLTLAQVGAVGISGLAIIAASLGLTFAGTRALGRRMGVDAGLAALIAAGTAVCGASAVLAVNAVVRARDEDAAYAVACVTLFGTLSMLAFPLIGAALSMAPADYGLWTGAAIHEVAQVVAAGYQRGAEAGEAATIAKLARVAMLAPLVAGLALAARRRGAAAGPAPFPWFVLGFLAAMLVASTGLVPAPVLGGIARVAVALLSVAMAAMGFETHVAGLRARGAAPLALAALAWVGIAAGALALVSLRAGV
ncbi:YeiH family protein [Frigidibacter sp. MR17.24]|uniref:YeiH family protein n=1 Tax=Frigidibacter sp. MR17.24 TaxID=3127345 RepID=UPI003012F6E9